MSNKGLEAARQSLARQHKAGIKQVRRTPVEKLKLNPRSLRLAVNAMCWECQGRDEDPGVIGRIRNCYITDCPLFNVRPHQIKSAEANNDKL